MKRLVTVLLGSVVVLGACSDDPSGPTGDQMSQVEAAFVAAQILASGELTTSTDQPAEGQYTVSMIPRTITRDLEVTHPCPAGGQVQLTWHNTLVFDDETGDLDLDVEGTQLHAGCAFTREGVTITVNGNPNIELSAHAELRNHQPSGEHTLNINGGFRWTTSDGRAGTCPIIVAAVTNFATHTRTIEGDVCGHTVRETLTWS